MELLESFTPTDIGSGIFLVVMAVIFSVITSMKISAAIIKKLEKTVEKLETRVDELEKENKDKDGEVSRLEKRVGELETDNASKGREIAALQNKNSTMSSKIGVLETNLNQERESNKQLNDELAKHKRRPVRRPII